MKISPLRAIRQKCLDCCCFQPSEVRNCTASKCPLYPYRTGHKPKGGNLSDEEINFENTQKNGTFSENTANYEAK